MITESTEGLTTTTDARLAQDYTGDTPTRSGNSRHRIHRVAGMVHQAIDKVEQTLDSKSRGVASTTSKYGDQARQYGDSLRERITDRPLQSAGIALAAGVVLDKIFGGKRRVEKVRIVRVPVPRTSNWDAHLLPERRAVQAPRAADSAMRDLRWSGEQASRKAGATADMAWARSRAMASDATGTAAAVPIRMRLALQQLLERSQQYGSAGRYGVQAHPLVTLGAALGGGALLTTLLLRGRERPLAAGGVTADPKSTGVAWQAEGPDGQRGAAGMIAARPVASAVVMLGIGALAGAMLRR